MRRSILAAILYSAAAYGFMLSTDRTQSKTTSLPDNTQEESYQLEDYSGEDANTTIRRKNFPPSSGFTFTKNADGTMTRNGDLNMSNITDVKEFFKYRATDNNALHIINKLGNRNEASKDMFQIDQERLTTQYLREMFPESNDTNISFQAESLHDFMLERSVKGKHIKCYVKRSLIPKYRCPISGMEGTLYGGNPKDDSLVVKNYCDELCVSPPLGCRGANSGEQANVLISGSATYSAGDSQATPVMFTLPINDKLRIDNIRFTIRANKNNNVDWHDFELSPIKMRYGIEYTDTKGTDHTAVFNYPTDVDLNISVVTLGALPNAKEVRVTFYPPYLMLEGAYKDEHLSDYLQDVTVSDLQVKYISDQYYFCAKDQIVFDEATDCPDGKIYTTNGEDGSFKICVSETGIKGPEKSYHGFYSRQSCERSCTYREECVPTFEHYDFADLKNKAAYRIDVGCVDDVGNSDCSPALCETLFASEQMPEQEAVYSPSQAVKYTVVGGSELPNVRRPKLDLAGEAVAAATGEYEDVFTETMKDAAYDNMIKSGTFNYVKQTVAQGTNPQNAYHRSVYRDPSPYKPPRIEIQWLVKPSSSDYNGDQYRFYMVAVFETIYKPISGVFITSDAYSTSYDQKNTPMFKDETYAALSSTEKFTPFFLKEYRWIQESNTSDFEWKENMQHFESRYVSYNTSSDSFISASPSAYVPYFKLQVFDRNKNWETFMVCDNLTERFTQENIGMVFIRQEKTGSTALPLKRWAGTVDTNSSGSLGRVRMYGFFTPSSQQLKASEIVKLIEDEPDKHIFFDTARYKSLPDEIEGDGAIKTSPIHIYLKGDTRELDGSAVINPPVQDEGKDAVLFMYLYEEK